MFGCLSYYKWFCQSKIEDFLKEVNEAFTDAG